MTWKQGSFAKNGKYMHCQNCGRYLYTSRLIDNKLKHIKCKCGTVNSIYPPRKGEVNGEKKIGFGVCPPEQDLMQCCYTADQSIP